MIDELLAQKFIDKISAYTSHNVNIINENGIIIAASKDTYRVGDFHELGYHMLQKGTPICTAELNESNPVGFPGVNMLMLEKGKPIGVVGVTGDPDDVYDIALILKMSVETMIEYESHHEMIMERKNTKLRFINHLLYTDDDEALQELPFLAGALDYDPHALRIPILIVFEGNVNAEEMLEKIKKSPYHTSQDISTVTRNNLIVLFKCFGQDKNNIFGQYKYLLGKYLSDFLQYTLTNNIKCKFYVGSFQNDIRDYRYSFQHCNWLKHTFGHLDKRALYFYDYILEYFAHRVPFLEYKKIYQVFEGAMSQELQDSLGEIISSLDKNNYNFNSSSKELFIHKNTLVFRLDKIKKFFDVNPVQIPSDRHFLTYLNYYLKNK